MKLFFLLRIKEAYLNFLFLEGMYSAMINQDCYFDKQIFVDQLYLF